MELLANVSSGGWAIKRRCNDYALVVPSPNLVSNVKGENEK